MIDLRCPHRKFGEVIVPADNDGMVEIMCPSRWCGRSEVTAVIHRFSTRTGELVDTRRFRQPNRRA